MANLANLVVRGISRLGNVIASTVTADNFVGTATKTEFIVGTQSASTGTWTGATQDSELYDGKEILFYLPYAGSGDATLNLTLGGPGGTTGAKNVYFQGTTRCTTHFPQYSVIRMTYHKAFSINGATYEGWWTEPGRDTDNDTYWQIRYYNAVKAAAAITSGYVIVGTSAGYKHVASAVTFDITYPILYAGSNVSSGSTSSNNYEVYQNVNLANTKANWTGTAYSEAYLVLSGLAGTTATIDSTVFTTTRPSSADNKYYIPIGIMHTTTNCIFHAQRRIMAYVNGAFTEYTPVADYAVSAGTAAKATGDADGNAIKTSYAASFSISDHTITLKNKAGNSLGTVTVPDNNTWTAMTGATSSANGTVGYVNAAPPKDGYNTKYLRADGTWAVPPDNNTWTAMTGATSSANGTVGYVNATPPKDGYNTKYLRADGTWTVPPNTWTAMTGATSSANGTVGYVNAAPPMDGYNTKFLRADGTWAVPTDNNTWTAMVGATSSANGSVGYVNAVPPKDGYNTKYLRADGTWAVPPNTWTAMTGATSSANGAAGYINATPPKDGYNTKYWRADGSWAVPPDTKYTAQTTSIGSASAGTAISADDITNWDDGSVPSLTYAAKSVGSASGWSAGTAATASVTDGVLVITNGTKPSLTITSVDCDDITAWDAGSVPTLTYTSRSIPNISVTSKTVATGITAS